MSVSDETDRPRDSLKICWMLMKAIRDKIGLFGFIFVVVDVVGARPADWRLESSSRISG